MARLKNLPSLETIKGFKGVLDFAVYRGVPSARRWPRTPRSHLTAATLAAATVFAEVVSEYHLLAPELRSLLTEETKDQPVSQRDIYVKAVYGMLHEVHMTDYLDILQSIDNRLELLEQLLDALGSINTDDLQVDVKTSALPTGAATQTTLASILAALDVALSTRSSEAKLEAARALIQSIAAEDFATQTTLASLLAELEKKADLTETQPISASTLPLPTGAATYAAQASTQTLLEGWMEAILSKLESIRLWNASLNRLFAIYLGYTQQVLNTNASAGNNFLYGNEVPAGQMWILTSLMARNANHDVRIALSSYDGATYVSCQDALQSATLPSITWSGILVLPPGSCAAAWFAACTAGDDLYLNIQGYKMLKT